MRGADVAVPVQDAERLASPLALLAASTVHVPHLALLLAELADVEKPEAAAVLTREARRQAAALVRLAHRALELHARDVGYDPRPWRDSAIRRVGVALADICPEAGDELGLAVLEVDRASHELAAAITAIPVDRMAVPGHVAAAQAECLSCYVRVRGLSGHGHPGC
jgi:hypothetical protein